MGFGHKISGRGQIIVMWGHNSIFPWTNANNILLDVLKVTLWGDFPVRLQRRISPYDQVNLVLFRIKHAINVSLKLVKTAIYFILILRLSIWLNHAKPQPSYQTLFLRVLTQNLGLDWPTLFQIKVFCWPIEMVHEKKRSLRWFEYDLPQIPHKKIFLAVSFSYFKSDPSL